MDRLARLRAPLAVVALVALTLVALARVGLGLSQLGPDGSRAVAAARLAPNAGDGTLTLLVAVLVVSCSAGPAVASRRRLAAWGAVLSAVSLVATVVALALTSVEVAGWNLVWLVPEVAVPLVVGLGLLALARPEPGPVPVPALDRGADEAGPAEADPGPDPELEPGWASDDAAGAVWRTAGEAARGAPASRWGQGESRTTGTGNGWGADPVAEPDRGPASGSAPGSAPDRSWGRSPEPPPGPHDPADR